MAGSGAVVSTDELQVADAGRVEEITGGFRIESMAMKDGVSRKVLWTMNEPWGSEMFSEEKEEWPFEFGFVIPGSTNSWEQTIDSAKEMLPAAVLSGKLVIETLFLDGKEIVGKASVRIFYE